MEKEFNQKEYIKEYQKENYKQFKTKLKPDEMEEVNEFLEKNNMNKREFILKSMMLLKRKDLMKVIKVEKVDELIENIINNAIEGYLTSWDINNSMSIDDWKLGSKGTIYGYDGSIIKYISYDDFKSLYSGFKYDLDKASDEVLNFIINYLNEEKKHINYNDLNREGYSIDEIEDVLNEN